MIGWLFAPEGPRRMALVRIALTLAMLLEAAPRWRYAVELYSSFGPAIPLFAGPLRENPAPSPPDAADANRQELSRERLRGFHAPIPDPLTAVGLHSALIVFLVFAALGWQTRLSLWLSAGIFLWIGLLDLPGTFAKHSVIAIHGLILLALSGCGNAWSVDARLRPRSDDTCRLSPAWPRRLLQLLICAIYLGAAITKIRSPAFLTGDLLTFSLLDDQWGAGRVGLWLSTIPGLMRLASLLTIAFELFFPVLVWQSRLRRWMLTGAFLLHAAMGLLLDLGAFSPTMFAILLVFLEEQELRPFPPVSNSCHADSGNKNARVLTSWNSLTAYLMLAAILVGCGLFVQWKKDWYGAFGNNSPAEVASFAPVSPRLLAEMQAGRKPAWDDYIHRVSFGTRTSFAEVFGAERQFTIGERLYVLVQFILPHPDLTLEGLLLGPDGEEVARFSHRVVEGYTHAINGFELTEVLAPGPYRVLLEIQGEEVFRRPIELRGPPFR